MASAAAPLIISRIVVVTGLEEEDVFEIDLVSLGAGLVELLAEQGDLLHLVVQLQLEPGDLN